MFESFKKRSEDLRKEEAGKVPWMEGPQTPEGQEVSPERLEQIRGEVLERVRSRVNGGVEVEAGLIENWLRNHGEDPERAEALSILKPILEEHTEKVSKAKEQFWRKFRTAASILWIYAASPQHSEKPELGPGRFDERDAAEQQLLLQGITVHQRQAYIPHLSEGLAKGLRPFGYRGKGFIEAMDIGTSATIGGMLDMNNESTERLQTMLLEAQTEDERSDIEYTLRVTNHRNDAWRMYLGLPQVSGTFGVSEYTPEDSKDDKYYYRLNSFLSDLDVALKASRPDAPVPVIKFLLDLIERKGIDGSNRAIAGDAATGIMGSYTISRGQDERGHYISYYDRWDLGESFEGEDGVVGKPYEIYDRIYYNPETFEVVEPTQDS